MGLGSVGWPFTMFDVTELVLLAGELDSLRARMVAKIRFSIFEFG